MKCLETTLNGTVDSNLMRKGEIRMKVTEISSPNSQTQVFSIYFNKGGRLEIIGDGYFTDKTLSANNGKTISIEGNNQNNIYFSNGNYEIAIISKYDLVSITINGEKPISFNIEQLKFSSSYTGFTNYDSNMYGDIGVLGKTKPDWVDMHNCKKLYGDIAGLANPDTLTYLNMYDSPVSGNLASLAKCSHLYNITLYGTQVSGDISSLSSNINMKVISIRNLMSRITGNVASLSNLVNLTDLDVSKTVVSGYFKELCEGMKNAGRTSGTLKINYVEGVDGVKTAKWDENTEMPASAVTATFSTSGVTYSGI